MPSSSPKSQLRLSRYIANRYIVLRGYVADGRAQLAGQPPCGLRPISHASATCRRVLSWVWTLDRTWSWERCFRSRASRHTRADSRSSACLRSVYFWAAYKFIISSY
jgi:hypothetical protein